MSKSAIPIVLVLVIVGMLATWFFMMGDLDAGEVDLQHESSDMTANPARVPARTPENTQIPATENKPTTESQKKKPVMLEPAAENEDKRLLISVYGKAVDTEGNPVVGASIELISINGPSKKVALTITDGKGHFRFDDGEIPPQKKGGKFGTFNVFGMAPGYGFAWHGMRSVYFGERPAEKAVGSELQRGYHRGERCVMTLVFGNARELAGIVVDENGDPVPDVSLSLRSCDYIDKEGKHPHVNYREFWGLSHLPESQLKKTSDLNGRFRFGGLPPECVFIVGADHPERSHRFAFGITTDRDPAKLDIKPNAVGADDSLIQKSPMRIVMPSTRSLRVFCVHPWSKAPIGGARVHAFRRGKDRQSSSGKTNAQGETDLQLPPGKFTVSIDPPADTELIRTRHIIEVKDSPPHQEFTLALDAAALVTFEAVDSKNGKGIKGVSFQYEDEKGRIMQVQRNLSYIDNPATDENGRLEVLMRPGKTRVMLGFVRSGTHKGEFKFRELELEGGKRQTVQFKLDPVAK